MQLYEFTVLRFYRLFLLTLQYIDTLRLYGFTVFSCSRCPRKKRINLPLYGFTLVSFASTPPLRFYAPKAARSDRKFRNLPFYGAFYGAFLWNNGIYHFTVLPFYGAPWQKTCLRPAPYTETPQFPAPLKEQHEQIINGIIDHQAGLSVTDPLTGLLLPPIKPLSDGSVTLLNSFAWKRPHYSVNTSYFNFKSYIMYYHVTLDFFDL